MSNGSMSALGQKQTCATQNVMSALHPIATAKAKFRKRPCLLCPQKRTWAVQQWMSAMGQKRHRILFDYFVGLRKQRRWHRYAQRLRSLEVDHQLVLGRRLYRKIGRLLAFENTIDVT